MSSASSVVKMCDRAKELLRGKDVLSAERKYLSELQAGVPYTVTDEDVLMLVRRMGELRYEKHVIYVEGERKNIRQYDEFSKRYTTWENKLFRCEQEAKLLGWLMEIVSSAYARSPIFKAPSVVRRSRRRGQS